MSRNSNILQWLLAAILIGCLALCLVSCKTCTPIVETVEKEKIVEIHTRDTAIITNPDSASIRALLHCDSAYNVVIDELNILQGWYINANAHTQHNNGGMIIEMDCKTDSLINEIQLRDSIIMSLEKTTDIIRESYVPNYYKNTSIGFWVLLALCICVIVARILIRVYLKK